MPMKPGNLLAGMLRDLPFSQDELRQLIATAPYRYKVYQIPKRQPGEFRTIAQPSKEIKLVQRWLINVWLANIPIHNSATAYRSGKSIKEHAAIHAGTRFLLKMDYKDFFPGWLKIEVQRPGELSLLRCL